VSPRDPAFVSRSAPETTALEAIGAAEPFLTIQNLQLAAHALGLGTCWMTAPLFARTQLHALLAVESRWQLAAVIPIGYAASVNTNRPRRLRLDRVTRWIE